MRPCSLGNKLGGGSDRLLLARLGLPSLLENSSFGLETTTLGGTGDDVLSTVSGYENTGHTLALGGELKELKEKTAPTYHCACILGGKWPTSEVNGSERVGDEQLSSCCKCSLTEDATQGKEIW